MKKIIFIFIIVQTMVFSMSFSGGKTFSLSGDMALPDGDVSTSEKTGYFLEFYPSEQEFIEAGLGLKFNHYLSSEDNATVTRLTTLYAIARFKRNLIGMFPYIQIRAGFPYSVDGELITEGGDLEGQIFGSLGVGTQIAFIDWSVNYEMNTYNYTKTTGGSDRVLQKLVTVSLGFKF